MSQFSQQCGYLERALPLFLIQIVSTLSFSVLYSTLVLYMKDSLAMEVSTANSIMGVFMAFNFALHLLGGFLGGRLLSYRALFCIGMLAQVVGCIVLARTDLSSLYWALAFFLTGSGLNVTCINCMLTQGFAPADTGREAAFLWNYAGMNIGFLMGFSMSGYFQTHQDYSTLFILSSLGNFIALLICLLFWRPLCDRDTLFSRKTRLQRGKASVLGLLVVALLPLFLNVLFVYAQMANRLVLLIGLFMLFYLMYLGQQQKTEFARDKINAFSVFVVVGTVFFMLYQIGPMGLILFIDHNVRRDLGNWVLSPQWFQNVNTLAIIFGGPILAKVLSRMRHKGISVPIPGQFAAALFCIGLAFILLPVGIIYSNAEGLVSPGWIVACLILQSLGELLITPIGYAMIGSLASPSLQGLFMGIWMLSAGVGSTLSSYSSNFMISGQNTLSPSATNPGYSEVFLSLGLLAIVVSVFVFYWIPKLSAWTHRDTETSLSNMQEQK